MTFFFHDISGLVLGTLATPLLGMLPGFALLRLLERAGLRSKPGWEQFGWALLLAFSVLPAIDALAIRFAGLPVAFAIRLALALAAVPTMLKMVASLDRIPRAFLAFGGLWWLVVAISFVDVDWTAASIRA